MKRLVRNNAIVLVGIVCFCQVMGGGMAVAQDADIEVITTEIGLDQVVTGPRQQKPAPASAADEKIEFSIDDQQLLQINTSLKNIIAENKQLLETKEAIEDEMKAMRGQREIRINRINALSRQRDDLGKRIDELEEAQQQHMARLEELQKTLEEKEQEFSKQLQDLQNDYAQKEAERKKALEMVLPRATDPKSAALTKQQLQNLKKQTTRTLRDVQRSAQTATIEMERLEQKNKTLQKDSADLHYNLGNMFFEQGKYDKAAVEYKKVVLLMPYDAAAHYNLALVSGDFLGDQETALKHYQEYLYLNPDADDAYLVQEKLLKAQLILKTNINAEIERTMEGF